MAGKKLTIASKIIFLVYLLIMAFMLMVITSIDVFPAKFIYLGTGILAVLSGIIAALIFRRSGGKRSRIVGLVLSALLIIGLVAGSVYMIKT